MDALEFAKDKMSKTEAALKRDFVEKNITIGIVRIGPHDLEKAGGLHQGVAGLQFLFGAGHGGAVFRRRQGAAL